MPTIPSSLVPRPDPIVAGRDPALAMLRAVACMVGGDGTSPVAWRREGLRWDEVEHVDLDEIAAWTAGHYRTDRSYPGAVIGSPNGAMAQLCALTRMPWLPQTMTVPVQWSSSRPPTAEQALRGGAGTAAAIVERNPAVRVHQVHGDHVVPWPGHRVSSFRCKQLRLPPAYTTFLDEVLAPGAPVLVLADESPWPVTTVSEHHLFQIGCRRAQAVEERAHGRRAGSALPGVLPRRQQGDVAAVGEPRPDSLAPEAEWGLDPELTDDVARWAHRTGHPLRHIRIPGPHALAAPVSDLHRNRARSCGQPDTTLTVSTAAPLMARTAGHVPYWVAPPLRQALTGLTAYLADAGYDAVEVRLHPVGDRNPGYREWHRLLECAERITFPPNRPALGDAEEVPEALPAPDVTEVLDALRESSAAAGVQVSH